MAPAPRLGKVGFFMARGNNFQATCDHRLRHGVTSGVRWTSNSKVTAVLQVDSECDTLPF